MATGSAALTLPVPTLQGIGNVSNVSMNAIGVAALTLPIPRISASVGFTAPVDTWNLTLPTPTLVAHGFTALVGVAKMGLPVPSLLASGKTGLVGSAVLTLPTPILNAYGPSSARLTLPTPALQATGFTGQVGSAVLLLPIPTLQAAGTLNKVASIALTLPVPTLTGRGLSGQVGLGKMTLPLLTISAGGLAGGIGTAELSLPMAVLAANGYGPLIGVLALQMPVMQLAAQGYQSTTFAQQQADQYKAIVLGTESQALTQYLNFNYNSMTQFQGQALAAGPSGLFVVDSGENDNGADIDAAAQVGITDFGTSFLKRVDRCYVGYRTNGNLVLRVYTDEINQRDYLLASSNRAGLHGNHVQIGKGLAARYWQFEVRNQQGADFNINSIELKPTHLRRRIGGGDA